MDSDVTRCPECWALVSAEGSQLHEDWHIALNRELADLRSALAESRPNP